ncbi:MAG: twin-arginine translocase TatA/TatE family subunit [Candidatus Velthaea sp.]|jgi:sec-independent protein translocase protein TatA
MFSVADMALAGAVALLLFGPDQLPSVVRKAGRVMRDVQNTSQSFIRELERAADDHEPPKPASPAASSELATPPIPEILGPLAHEPIAHEPIAHEPIAHEAPPAEAGPHGSAPAERPQARTHDSPAG